MKPVVVVVPSIAIGSTVVEPVEGGSSVTVGREEGNGSSEGRASTPTVASLVAGGPSRQSMQAMGGEVLSRAAAAAGPAASAFMRRVSMATGQQQQQQGDGALPSGGRL
jgi:hypothetical protein